MSRTKMIYRIARDLDEAKITVEREEVWLVNTLVKLDKEQGFLFGRHTFTSFAEAQQTAVERCTRNIDKLQEQLQKEIAKRDVYKSWAES